MERTSRDPEPVEGEDETSEPIGADSYGQIVEVTPADDVDGDLNGAPELAGLNESREWTGVDALDGMRGREAQDVNLSDDAPLAERVAALERERDALVERLEELTVEATIAEELGRKIRRIDEALARCANEGTGGPD